MSKLVFFALFFLSTCLSADTIELNDGRMVNCTFISRTDEHINVDVDGVEIRLAAKDVKKINIGTSSTESGEEVGGDGRIKPKGEIPVGTVLIVRLNSTLHSGKDTSGQMFSASLERALQNKGVTVVPAGSKIYGMITQSFKGINAEKGTRKKQKIDAVTAKMMLNITQVNIEGRLLPVQTSAIDPSAGKAPTQAKEQDVAAQVIIPEGTLLEFTLGKALIH